MFKYNEKGLIGTSQDKTLLADNLFQDKTGQDTVIVGDR